MPRPNILIITTDQQRWDALSLWGRPGFYTPYLDRLGKEGVIFDRAYTPAPVCTPARVSMITGQYSTRHGAYSIGMEPVPALKGPTLGSLFSAAGYATALIGKTHFCARRIEDQHVAGQPLDAPLPNEAFWENFDGPYCGFQHVRHCQNHNADKAPSAHYRRWLNAKGLQLDPLHMRQLDGTRNDIPRGCWEGMRPEWTQNAWITEESIQFLNTLPDDQPWLVMANYQDPHYPLVCPEPYYSAVDMHGVDLGHNDHDLSDKPPFYPVYKETRRWADGTEADSYDFAEPNRYGKWPFYPPNINPFNHYGNDRAPAIRAYLGMCKMLDDYIGQLLDHLESKGLTENTLILFASDHGEMLAQHGIWGKGLPAYEDNQRIPTLMRWPAAQNGPVGHSGSHFNLVDILPTALDAAGIPFPPFVQGVSQLPALKGEVVRDWALVDFNPTEKIHQQSLIWEEHKLVVYRHADYGELYNLQTDPEQNHNLWDLPDHTERKARMMHKLVQACMETVGTTPEHIDYA